MSVTPSGSHSTFSLPQERHAQIQAYDQTLGQSIHKIATEYSTALWGAIDLIEIGSGAAAAGLFTTISPLGGSLFAVSNIVTRRSIDWICDKVNCCPDGVIARTAKGALHVIAGLGAGYAALYLGGFPVTLSSVVVLTVGSLLLTSGLIVGGLLLATPFAVAYAASDICNDQPNDNSDVELTEIVRV